MPNTFTPDGDGINDVFLPSLDGFAVREYNLTIWNRWGEMIFETDDEAEAWDGSLGEAPVQDGVYIWQIELHAKNFVGRKRMRGHVTVLR
ncbi:MAG: gliding motility-associated C-terminal domain-containing protein [Flavobacteriales bacterium]|nr:gliding motility-associated C-terminal domain-containing protein [Flavobacteriales bacterium]